MFTASEKNGAFGALHTLANAGAPQTVTEARALMSAMQAHRTYFLLLEARAMEQVGKVLGVEVKPDDWTACEGVLFGEATIPICEKLAGYIDTSAADEEEDDEEPAYSFLEHAFGSADYGIGRAA